ATGSEGRWIIQSFLAQQQRLWFARSIRPRPVHATGSGEDHALAIAGPYGVMRILTVSQSCFDAALQVKDPEIRVRSLTYDVCQVAAIGRQTQNHIEAWLEPIKGCGFSLAVQPLNGSHLFRAAGPVDERSVQREIHVSSTEVGIARYCIQPRGWTSQLQPVEI